jgi:light-regulated signal transduction histidine kinase (bacteriophytochrome)/ActR/RegA family two-component response regulator
MHICSMNFSLATPPADRDLMDCADEPIHIPGLVQPHGMLLAVGLDGQISHASANLSLPLCRDAATALGRPLADVLGQEIAALAMAAPEVAALHLPETTICELTGNFTSSQMMVSAHRYNGRVIIDLEPPSADEATMSLAWLHRMQREMLLASQSRGIAMALARALQTETGYDRVMVYEFDRDWHGHVVGEALAEGIETQPFLDLHFPASDIPAQARTLYRRQLMRIVVDSHAPGIALLSVPGEPPLDMSFAALRSVSPVHLEYLRNMGVRSSMVASILVGDQLWGLVVGHHQRDRRVPRVAARLAIQMAAMLTGGILSSWKLATALMLTGAIDQVLARIAARLPALSPAAAVAAEFPRLAELLGIDGLLVQIGGDREAAGAAMVWPKPTGASDTLIVTERFADNPTPDDAAPDDATPDDATPDDATPADSPITGHVVGGAVLRLGDETGDLLVLGRLEYERVLTWGGDPSKPTVESSENPGMLKPRHSFDRWKQTVRGRCRPFGSAEMAALDALQQRLSLLVHAENERQLRERAHQTERMSAIGLVAGGVAHDLNNLLGVINLNLDLALDPASPREAIESIEAALAAVRSGSNVASALLSFARKQLIMPVDLDPATFLPEFCTMARVLLGNANEFELLCDADVGLFHADVAQLQTALLNLMVNARDSLEKTGGSVTISAHHVTTRHAVSSFGQMIPAGDYVALSVADTGPGMSADVLRHAADPFFTTKGTGKGTGLGLPMVFGFAAQSGGAVTIESVVGRGTVVTILLPRKARRCAQVAAPVPERAASALFGRRILIVEDRPDLSGVISGLCRKAGLAVTVAATASRALTLLQPGAFDLVLSDLMLDGAGSGLDVLARARELAVPILLMTGFVSASESEAAELSHYRVLRKPFHRRELLDALEELTAVHRKQQAVATP